MIKTDIRNMSESCKFRQDNDTKSAQNMYFKFFFLVEHVSEYGKFRFENKP